MKALGIRVVSTLLAQVCTTCGNDKAACPAVTVFNDSCPFKGVSCDAVSASRWLTILKKSKMKELHKEQEFKFNVTVTYTLPSTIYAASDTEALERALDGAFERQKSEAASDYRVTAEAVEK